MPSERVLIVGAGVSGSILAFFLAKHNYIITVIERSRASQKAGQGIEIEEPALQVVTEMGILPLLKAKRTNEKGFELVNSRGGSCGILKIGGPSPTGALELMRGDLTEILHKAADASPNVTYLFESTLDSLRQTSDTVLVDVTNRSTETTSTLEFDMVIGADGVRSRTRDLIMGRPSSSNKYYSPIGAFVAYFSIPKQSTDSVYSQLCHFPHRRMIWTRPVAEDSEVTSVYLIHAATEVPALSKANAANDRQAQKEAFAELYADAGWESPRIMKEMLGAKNFYSDELVQVKLPSWSKGRVALVGDAAWAPSPFTGQGNQLAIIGAWVLAQEMARNRGIAGFETYEKRLRGYVKEAQKIALYGYAPLILNPETKTGIWVLRMLFWVLALLVGLLEKASWAKGWMPDKPQNYFDLQ